MATKIVTKNSSTASAVPTASDLVQGELAVNVADKRLFTEDNAGAIVELGTNPSTLTVTGEITANGGIALGDSDKATFGAGDDLQIYHDGSHSYVSEQGTGNLRIYANDLVLANNDGSQTFLYGQNGGPVSLSYANNAKIATTATGIDVTGTATMDGLTVDGTATVVGTTTSGILLKSASGASNGFKLYNDSGTDTAHLNNHFSGSMVFSTNNTERMRIDSSGNVGIGVAPAFPFHVQASDGALAQFSNGVDADCTIRTASGVTLITPSTGTLALGTSSTERMRIDSSGNVGIGTSSPSYKLDLNGDMRFTSGSAMFWADTNVYEGRTGNDRYWVTGGSERMRIDSSGNVKLITANDTAGTAKFLTFGTMNYNRAGIKCTNAATYDGSLEFYTGNASNFAERMRIDSSGNLLVGKTSTGDSIVGVELQPSGALVSCRDGSIAALFNRLSSNGEVVRFNRQGVDVGSIDVTTTATSYTTSSDQRLKENIADADDAGSKIDAIQVRKYDWKADGSHQDYGMVAQELQLVAPEAVSGDADSEEMMGVDYSKLVPMLIKEIQSLRNRVAQLEE